MEIKELCRAILTRQSQSNRTIAAAAGVSHNTVQRYRDRLLEEQLEWVDIAKMSAEALDRRLNSAPSSLRKQFSEPDFSYIHEELRKVGVTLLLLHEEYAKDAGEAAMSETEFRRRYKKFSYRLGLVMRQVHRPGEKMFLDYSGKRPCILDIVTGQLRPVELFVAVLGASKKTFMFATETQNLADWCEANVRALEFYGGVTESLVPDNLKAAVDSISRTEGALINYTYSQLARHYNTFVVPTRVKKPKDKAPVELGVKLAQRWGIAKLRNRTFTSIGELNIALAELTEAINSRPMKKYRNKSRNQLFEELDRPALRALPEYRYEFAQWRLNFVVPQDYHVQWNNHYYSVPYRYVGDKVRIRITASVLEVYLHSGDMPIATHVLSEADGGCSTMKEHQPQSHRAYAEDQGAELFAWAQSIGADVGSFVHKHAEIHRRPALTLQAVRGLKKLGDQHGAERLNSACKRAISIPNVSVTSVRSMLSRRIENTPLRGRATSPSLPQHQNVRGADSYK